MRFSVGVAYGQARDRADKEIDAARSARKAIVARMEDILTDGTVICLPTTPGVAPLLDGPRGDFMGRLIALTTPASTIGAPQISLPLAQVDGLPVGLSLIGPKGSDEMLIAFARQVAAAL
jgi:amidase